MARFDIGSYRRQIRCSFVSRSEDWSRRTTPFIAHLPHFLLLTAGERRFLAEGADHHAQAGDLICFPEGDPVYNERAKHVSWKGYRLQYILGGANRAPEWVDLPAVIHQVSPEIRGHIRAISMECLGKGVFERRRARAYLELFLTSLAGLVRVDSPVRLLERVIREHQEQNISLDMAAELCNVSPATLKRHLRQHRDETFSQFKHGIKIALAQQLLEIEPEATLAEVADQLGFHDAFHLSRTFKKVTGVSPRDYRRTTTDV